MPESGSFFTTTDSKQAGQVDLSYAALQSIVQFNKNKSDTTAKIDKIANSVALRDYFTNKAALSRDVNQASVALRAVR